MHLGRAERGDSSQTISGGLVRSRTKKGNARPASTPAVAPPSHEPASVGRGGPCPACGRGKQPRRPAPKVAGTIRIDRRFASTAQAGVVALAWQLDYAADCF